MFLLFARYNLAVEFREDVHLSGPLVIVLLYQDEAFWFRVLNGDAQPKPTYITPRLPAPTNELISIAMLYPDNKYRCEFGDITLRIEEKAFTLRREGEEGAMGFGNRRRLQEGCLDLLRKVGIN